MIHKIKKMYEKNIEENKIKKPNILDFVFFDNKLIFIKLK